MDDKKIKISDYVDDNYKKDEYYSNIFILLKLLYLNNKCSYYIPTKIANTLLKNLKTLDLLGYNETFDMFIIPQNSIDNFFRIRNTLANDENKYIQDKLDLYISLLTYIYYYLLPRNSHNYIVNLIQSNLVDDEDINNALLSSTVYDFKNIYNNVEKFFYEKVVINEKEEEEENDLVRMTYHLDLLYNFYNTYILQKLISNKNVAYKNHPLEVIRYTISNNKME